MFGEKASNMFYIYIGLSQGSCLIPYLFIAFRSDLINLLGAHSGHVFADDLNVLIKLLGMRALAPMIEYFENEGTRVCDRISTHSKKWEQPINITKTSSQHYNECAKERGGERIQVFGFTWTSKLVEADNRQMCRKCSEISWKAQVFT